MVLSFIHKSYTEEKAPLDSVNDPAGSLFYIELMSVNRRLEVCGHPALRETDATRATA
jgi:hypothetical protein